MGTRHSKGILLPLLPYERKPFIYGERTRKLSTTGLRKWKWKKKCLVVSEGQEYVLGSVWRFCHVHLGCLMATLRMLVRIFILEVIGRWIGRTPAHYILGWNQRVVKSSPTT